MEKTPTKAGREPREGARFLSVVLADNIRTARTMARGSQADLVSWMRYLGHNWSRRTVSDVERGQRNVTVDELLALHVALGRVFPDLLDPTGLDGRASGALDWGGEHDEPMPASTARAWIGGRIGFGLRTVPAGTPIGASGVTKVSGVLSGGLELFPVAGYTDAYREAQDAMKAMHAARGRRVASRRAPPANRTKTPRRRRNRR